ncbi:MAG: hypothetical protein ABI434_07925 [Burkholderiaceae bacterium]
MSAHAKRTTGKGWGRSATGTRELKDASHCSALRAAGIGIFRDWTRK